MKSEVKKGIVLNYVLLFATNIIGLIYTPFLIRNLGQSEYGLYSLVNSIIGYLFILDFGFSNALVVYASKYKMQNKEEELKKLYGMFKLAYYIIAGIAAFLGLILYFNISNIFGNTMTIAEISKAKVLMLILSFNLVINFAFTIYNSIIIFNEKFVFQKGMNLLITILKPFIMLPLLLLGAKSISLAIITTVLNMVIIIANYIYCKKKLNVNIKICSFDKVLAIEILVYSFYIFLSSVVDKVNWSVDQVILGTVSGTIAVSVYAVASQINMMYINFSSAIANVMLPKISKIVAQSNSKKQLDEEFIKVGRIQYIIIFLILTGFIIFGKDFIMVWAGKEYIMAYYITIILIVPVTIPLAQNLGISILQAKNMHKFRSLLYLGVAICNVLISIPLAKMYGGVGCAIGTGLSLFISNGIIINIYYYKKVNLDIISFWKNILKITLKEVVPLVFIILFVSYTNFSSFYNLLIGIPIYSLLYCLYTYKFVLNRYEKDLVLIPFRKLKLVK